ncbi:Putative inner membrane exporter, YdcZ [Anaerocolumna jejuensis DSM 15929]|uniref:Putative inner membrane exporter, YdcZ n=1 Tax=Anaerocolumna jejuensis DSM 15929 TaxID=1121322 RepID=A0A1M6SU64_9FIRM|nr:DMT family transporter [Anaerocolumna jejuensis]SHK48253.1 Putative inner membrane exporter, YdcZ [Anaerocolumna jejuensis DSM 15929]
MLVIYLILSILAGVTVVLGRILNAKLAEKIGTVQATVINYVVGIFFSFLFLLIMNRGLSFTSHPSQLPFWAYLGGILGVAIIMISNYTTPRVPAFYLTLLVFLGQLAVGILIDWLVSKDFSPLKLIGSLFVVAGFTYNLLLDKKSSK